MANSTDSTSIDHSSPLFSNSHLIQSFPFHDTVKLDEKSFVQWQQHVRLISEGYELLGFLESTLPVPPRFVASPNGALTPNPDASTFVQQDKLLASWLLSTTSASLLSCFTAAKMACDVWTIANRLFAASTGAKVPHVRYELHSVTKGFFVPKFGRYTVGDRKSPNTNDE
ncbi:pheophytinase, chloroplastic-like [Gossypium australe]|uniref:Pheophytinase, chloroplastic-like n=1 Tax=Gossypium australe TaxID=47621 RepID=A0A5B6VKI7_9ROSI|nr:pheophytinase, chloroplastic-like [Gossypium australe]